MRKLTLAICTLILTLLSLITAAAQTAEISSREAEWQSYALPATDFVRQVDASGTVVFRVPVTWTQDKSDATKADEKPNRFIGPYSSVLQITVEQIPDGMPLQDYVSAITQHLHNLPGSPDALVVRRTEMSGLDAREIMFELPDVKGNLTRRLIWCAVDGPTAVAVVLIEPDTRTTEIEPYFRSVVQSLMTGVKEKYVAFEAARSTAIKDAKPGRIDEVQALIPNIIGLDVRTRAAAAARLTSLFVTAPDVAIDLVQDRRPLVRAAALQAIGQSRNHALDPFLLKGLHDSDVFVADRAALAVAALPDVLAALRKESFDLIDPETTGRVWPYLNKGARLQILAGVFGTREQTAVAGTSRTRPAAPTSVMFGDSSSKLGLLTLLTDVPASDFKLPLAQLVREGNDALTTAALQVALERREDLPVTELFKLLSSASVEGQRLAARNLGESATSANITQIEDFVKRLATPATGVQSTATATPDKNVDRNRRLAEELKIAIKQIRLREGLAAATAESRSQLLKAALADPELADWAWARLVRDEQVRKSGPGAGAGSSQAQPGSWNILPLGDNAFPEQVTHYVAVPEPVRLLHKLSESLNSIQMDSARSQANLVLLLNGLRAQVGSQFGAPSDQSVFDYFGIKISEPIAMSSWVAQGAPQGIMSAQRKAIVLRVADRDRFERSLAVYQKQVGNFAVLPDYVAVGARFLAVLPEILPLSAEMMVKDKPDEKKELPIISYGLGGQTELDGYAIRFFTQRRVSAQGTITNDSAYLMYVGEVALLAPDLASLHDVLMRVRSGGSALANNSEFKAAVATGAEAIYLSDLEDLFGSVVGKPGPPIKESGALKISNTSWESSYHLTFSESDWVKPLVGFQPEELSAPRDLLPRSTVVYYFMKLDAKAAWKDWGKETFDAASLTNAKSVWAGDFDQEILPELGPECGAAILEMPDLSTSAWQTPVVFFAKLKSDKLQRAFEAGHLFKTGTDGHAFVKLQLGSADIFVTIKNGFLIAANSDKVLPLLDQKEKLADSPDFVKAAKRTPGGVVAFGGYNLEATSILRNQAADSVKAQGANMILSLTRAFHSPSLSATANRGRIDASSSVSLDREGRYSVAELQALTAKSELTFAVLQPSGLPILNQNRIKSLALRIHSRASGEIERIAEDVASGYQSVDQRTERELRLRVLPRRTEPKERIQLPVTGAAFAPFLQSSKEIAANDKSVVEQARKIAGTDRDAWSVARKLSEWTYKNLTWKRVDYADAAQTLATREADCYEFSKLYVAMARSLGLPARVVSGLAYSGSAFGGHAWVEVYAGSWIELDPTWGTDFVDATHVRDASGALLTYAALDLVQIEVLDAPRTVEDFQLDATALARQLRDELFEGRETALSASLDMAVLTDELMGTGTWATLTDDERGQISANYPRVISEVTSGLKKTESQDELRLLAVKVTGDRAEAALIQSTTGDDSFLKFHMVRSGGAWLLTDMVLTDSCLRVISEVLMPAISEIRERRNGKKPGASRQTDFVRVLLMVNRDPKAAIELADKLLKDNSQDTALLFLKSLALANADKVDETIKLWAELGEGPKPLAVAVLNLARHFANSKEAADKKKAIDLYTRYLTLEPEDPRARTGLAVLYENAGDFPAAEREYRAAVEHDSSSTDVFVGLAAFYGAQKRFKEALAALDEATKRTGTKDDLFAALIMDFWADDDTDVPEGLAASDPRRMAHSAAANLNLARIRIDHEHPREALPLLRKAVTLDSKSSQAYTSMAEAHRKLREWIAALTNADTAIRLADDNGEAHYQRACILARLGRKTEALASLKRAIELDDSYADLMVEEEDLKSLATMPDFKKLLPASEKQ